MMDVRWNQQRWHVLSTGKRWWVAGETIFYLRATNVVENPRKTWALKKECALITVRDRFGALVPDPTAVKQRVRVPRWQGEA